MGFSKEYKNEIKNYIIEIIDKGENPYQKVPDKYQVSRQTLSKYIKEFLKADIIEKKSKNIFELKNYVSFSELLKNNKLEEDVIYEKLISKYEKEKKENVIRILNYAFTEMLNNAIEHSSGKEISILYAENYKRIFICIEDNGIGIFKKIKESHNLENENQAIFELQKGKLTSDIKRHSGEGIFFVSKVVNFFRIKSFDKEFHTGDKHNIYSFEKIQKDKQVKGTEVLFIIEKDTDREISEVFKEYTNDYIFDKTTITVHLAKEYLGQKFISRSEARRILLNVDKFKTIVLDFSMVENIGQGFADEIFRVYADKNPNITILPINQNENVDFMIKRALNSKNTK